MFTEISTGCGAIFILFCGFMIWFGIALARTQNQLIDRCFELRGEHDDLLTGKLKPDCISGKDLIDLQRPMFTYVGLGGVGPMYNPMFAVREIASQELSHRRSQKRK